MKSNLPVSNALHKNDIFGAEDSSIPYIGVAKPSPVVADSSNFFVDPAVNLIDSAFLSGIRRGLIHHFIDDEQLNGKNFRIKGKEFTNFSTCSYFALEHDPRVKSAIVAAVEKYGASFIMSRTYASSPQFLEFESLLTKIFDAYPVVTPSTTLGHLAFMSVMVQSGDAILLDQQVHNSVQMAASTVQHKAQVVIVKHSDMSRLEQRIQKLSQDSSVNRIWYSADGIYSMFGDTVPISALLLLLDKYPKFYCYIDDAHGMGVFGKNGRGFVLDAQKTIHPKMVVAVSLSKCFGMGCGGALVLPNKEWQRKIRTCGSTMIFSSPIPPPMLGGGVELAKIHLSPEIETFQFELSRRVKHFRTEAEASGIPLVSSPRVPVQYITVGSLESALEVVEAIFKDGYFVNICAYPAVPKNRCGLRLTITRNVDLADISGLVASICKALNRIKS